MAAYLIGNGIGAPERRGLRVKTLSTQKIDTWSLGCVFSITATWVVLGLDGIKQYSELRKKAIRNIIKAQSTNKNLPNASKLTPGDYFHDGDKVLDEVLDWHTFLRKVMRKTDTTTSRILDLIENSLLQGDLAQRVSAKDLCKLLKEILNNTKADPRMTIPNSVVKHLLEIDRKAPPKLLVDTTPNRMNALSTVEDRRVRKEKFLAAPLRKTANRCEYTKSESIGSPASPTLSEIHIPGDTPASYESAYGSGPYCQASITEYAPYTTPPKVPRSRTHDVVQRPNRHSLTKASKTSPPQNVFQAREEIKQKRKGLKKLLSRKDKILSQHFENRDIVRSLIVALNSVYELTEDI